LKGRVIDTVSVSGSVNVTVNTCDPVVAPDTARTRNCLSNAVIRVPFAFALKVIVKSPPETGFVLVIVPNVVATPPEVWMMSLPDRVMPVPAIILNWTLAEELPSFFIDAVNVPPFISDGTPSANESTNDVTPPPNAFVAEEAVRGRFCDAVAAPVILGISFVDTTVTVFVTLALTPLALSVT